MALPPRMAIVSPFSPCVVASPSSVISWTMPLL